MSIVNKLVEGGHLTPEQVERIGESVHEFMKEADANPALVEEYLEKMGFNIRHPVALAGAVSLGASAAGALGSLGLEAARDWYHDLAKAKRYKKMIEANPELKMKGVNAKLVQMHFGTLNKFNPDYAKDPMVAGAYVQNQLEAARPNIESLNNIVAARKNMAQVANWRKITAPTEIAGRVGETAIKALIPEQPPPERYPALSRAERAVSALRAKKELEGFADLEVEGKGLDDPLRGGSPELLQSTRAGVMEPYQPLIHSAIAEARPPETKKK